MVRDDPPGRPVPAVHRCTRRAAMQRSLGVVAAGIAAGVPAAPALAQQPPTGVTKLIGDVLDFALSSSRWRGRFGFVTFRLHTGLFNGERAYFIRTDASDQAFAREQGLVFAPKLALALESREPATADLYLFDHTAAAGQLPVLSSVPGLPDFSPAFRVHRVTWRTAARTLASAAQVRAAEQANEVRVERTTIVVNYPVVKWPGGELPADPDKEQYLGGGQLIEPVNTQAMTVTFKLHECYPASRYIVTDTSAVPMAPMMRVGAAAASQRLAGVRATAKIYVFGRERRARQRANGSTAQRLRLHGWPAGMEPLLGSPHRGVAERGRGESAQSRGRDPAGDRAGRSAIVQWSARDASQRLCGELSRAGAGAERLCTAGG